MLRGTTQRRPSSYIVNEAGTRYIKVKPKPVVREKASDVAAPMREFMKGEAKGDVTLAALLAVRNVIQLPSRYCRSRAVSKTGQQCETTAPDAWRWSIIGALELVTFPMGRTERRKILDVVKLSLPQAVRGQPLFRWEEDMSTSHGQVLALMNRAIASQKTVLGYSK